MSTYKPGEKAPQTGTIRCVRHPEVVKHIKQGETGAITLALETSGSTCDRR